MMKWDRTATWNSRVVAAVRMAARRASKPGVRSNMKFGVYACLSTLLAASTITYAVQQKQQFYPTVVFLVTSKFSIVVLVNFSLVLTLILGRIAKSVFLGRLRDAEREIVYDNVRYAIPETCVALTIFHEELNIKVFALFTALLFSKVFHWLSQSRVEHVEQADSLSRLTHVRLVALIFVLLSSDAFILGVCTYLCMQHGPSVLILFGFEYAILAVTVLTTLVRYVLHLIDLQVEGTWHAKGSYVFFLEFLTEAFRFFLFLVFFMIVFTFYGMPLNIVRELWGSYNNLRQRLTQFRNYRKLMVNLNERFPDATEEELERCEHTCIICRDHMTEGKKLPCGHIFHMDCLRLWLQQQQSCPTCREPIPVDPPAQPRAAREAQQAAPDAPQPPPPAVPNASEWYPGDQELQGDAPDQAGHRGAPAAPDVVGPPEGASAAEEGELPTPSEVSGPAQAPGVVPSRGVAEQSFQRPLPRLSPQVRPCHPSLLLLHIVFSTQSWFLHIHRPLALGSLRYAPQLPLLLVGVLVLVVVRMLPPPAPPLPSPLRPLLLLLPHPHLTSHRSEFSETFLE